MPDFEDKIPISEFSYTNTLHNTDQAPIIQQDGADWDNFRTSMADIGLHINKDMEYVTDLHTTSKKIIGAINELADNPVDVDITSEITTPAAVQTFADGGDNIPLKSCEVAIVAQQASGTPSPSNPLSISGFSAVAVGDYSKYHRIIASSLTPQTQSGITITPKSNGVFEISGTATGAVSINFEFDEFTVFSDDGRTININNDFASNSVTVIYRYGSTTIDTWTLSSINRTYTNFGLLSGKTLNNLTIGIASGTTVNGTIKTEFLVNNTGTTHTVSLGQTIYGGTADVVNGNGSKTWLKVDLSQLNFQRTGSGVFYTSDLDSYIAPTPSDAVASLNIKSSIFQSIPRDDIVGSADGSMAQRAGGIVYFQYTSASTVEAFKTAMSGVDFICKLATPTAFTFTGANIPTLSGTNNIYADSGDIQSLEYFNDKGDDIASMVRLMTRS
jgi:hypothetical protein